MSTEFDEMNDAQPSDDDFDDEDGHYHPDKYEEDGDEEEDEPAAAARSSQEFDDDDLQLSLQRQHASTVINLTNDDILQYGTKHRVFKITDEMTPHDIGIVLIDGEYIHCLPIFISGAVIFHQLSYAQEQRIVRQGLKSSKVDYNKIVTSQAAWDHEGSKSDNTTHILPSAYKGVFPIIKIKADGNRRRACIVSTSFVTEKNAARMKRNAQKEQPSKEAVPLEKQYPPRPLNLTKGQGFTKPTKPISNLKRISNAVKKRTHRPEVKSTLPLFDSDDETPVKQSVSHFRSVEADVGKKKRRKEATPETIAAPEEKRPPKAVPRQREQENVPAAPPFRLMQGGFVMLKIPDNQEDMNTMWKMLNAV